MPSEYNENLDIIASKLGYVVHDTRTKTYDIIGTHEECQKMIQGMKDIDADMKKIGIDNNYSDHLEILSIQGIHKSTIRSLTKRWIENRIFESKYKNEQ
jgi:hypothetical protein